MKQTGSLKAMRIAPLAESGLTSAVSASRTRKSGDRAASDTIDLNHDAADIAFERAVVDCAERIWFTNDWTMRACGALSPRLNLSRRSHPPFRPFGGAPGPIRGFREDPWSFFVRYFNFWALNHKTNAHAYLQPSEDVYAKLNDSWFDGMKLFASIFGVALMELALQRPPEERVGRTTAWAASTACFSLAAPIMLTTIPIVFEQSHALACVRREHLREFVCWHAYALGLPHRMAILSFEFTFLGVGCRLYALFQFERMWYLPLGAFAVGILIAGAAVIPTMWLNWYAMEPWPEAVQAAAADDRDLEDPDPRRASRAHSLAGPSTVRRSAARRASASRAARQPT